MTDLKLIVNQALQTNDSEDYRSAIEALCFEIAEVEVDEDTFECWFCEQQSKNSFPVKHTDDCPVIKFEENYD